MHTSKAYLLLLFLFAALAGCAVTPAHPSSQILGTWQSEVGGFEITSTYTATGVMVEGHAAMPYSLEDDMLVVDGDETTVRIISFDGSDLMKQLDPMTNTEHLFTRLNN